MLTIRVYPAIRRIKEAQHTTKPNPPKDGEGKPRDLTSIQHIVEAPWHRKNINTIQVFSTHRIREYYSRSLSAFSNNIGIQRTGAIYHGNFRRHEYRGLVFRISLVCRYHIKVHVDVIRTAAFSMKLLLKLRH